MNINDFKTLKIGDLVSPLYGKNRGQLCKVQYIWDITDSDDYREILIGVNYIDDNDKKESKDEYDLFISYRALKRES